MACHRGWRSTGTLRVGHVGRRFRIWWRYYIIVFSMPGVTNGSSNSILFFIFPNCTCSSFHSFFFGKIKVLGEELTWQDPDNVFKTPTCARRPRRQGVRVKDKHQDVLEKCPVFDEWREQAGKRLRNMLEERLSKAKVEEYHKNLNMALTKAEFYADDTMIWLLVRESRFYLGNVSILSSWLLREGTIHGMYWDWGHDHDASERLASSIFG